MSATIPDLSHLSVSLDQPSCSTDTCAEPKTPKTLKTTPRNRVLFLRPQTQTLEQLNGYSTGSHHRDRRYTPIDIDLIDKNDAYESSLSALATKRSSAAVSMVIKTSSENDTLARALVALGESIAKRLVGYHPNATFDVDVVTSQQSNTCSIKITDVGVNLFTEAMCSNNRVGQQLQRVMLKRAGVEARMLFLRVPDARFYDVDVVLPDGTVASEREYF